MATVAIDAGHGGMDSGATYKGRQEKDDVLRLAMAVGGILENNGVNVSYTRTNDTYETPFKKAQDANASGADLFISIHRNSGTNPNTYNGIQSLIFRSGGIREELSKNINDNLEDLGFQNLGIEERPNLVVLRRSSMPAALLEVGFINNDADNQIFDSKFNEIAQGIADGILETLRENRLASTAAPVMPPYTNPMNTPQSSSENGGESINPQNMDNPQNYFAPNMTQYPENASETMYMNDSRRTGNCPCTEKLYRVQVGAYRNKESADRILNSLLIEGFPAFIIFDDGLFKIQVGAFEFLANAIAMEERLRKARYNTYITT